MSAATAIGALLSVALLTPAQHPMGAARGASGGTVDVRVEHVSPAGAVTARAGVEVVLETWRSVPGPRREAAIGDCWRATSDAAGLARFRAVPPLADGDLIASTVLDGVTFRTEPIRQPAGALSPAALRTYDAITDRSRLTARVQLDVDVRDAFLIVDLSMSLDNPDRVVVDLGRAGEGLRFPVPLPSVFGGALDAGMIPAATSARHMSTRVVPDRGRFVFRRGQVTYEGPVLPGDRQSLQLRYALPIVDARQDIAFTAPLDITQLAVSATWPRRTAPVVVPDRAHQGIERAESELHRRFARVLEPPKAGEVFVLRIDRLPVSRAFYMRLALGGAAALLVIFALTLLAAGARRRDAV